MQAVLVFGFECLQLNRISATCDTQNIASERVMQKLGMTREALLRENQVVEEKYRSTYLYSLLHKEWLSTLAW
jgi:RimJ/RimL family protein N-acetyltransferase